METITITNGAVQLIHQSVLQGGWATDAIAVYRGGKLGVRLEEEVFEKSPAPKADFPPVTEGSSVEEKEAYGKAVAAHQTDQYNWLIADANFEVSKADKELIKTCIDFHVAKGAIAPSTHFISLMDALGLAPDEG